MPQHGETIYYHHNSLNAGVSAGYNKGFEKAKELGKRWLLLLDQDSLFDVGNLEKYAESIALHPDIRAFAPLIKSERGLLSPFKVVGGKGIRIKARQPGAHFFRPVHVINSGLLIACSLFEAAGGYNELFPLDFSDVAFIKRLSAIDRRFVLIDMTLIHSLSSENDRHSSTKQVFDRFDKFCKAAKLFKKTNKELVILGIVILPRAIKLTLIKKEVRFLVVALRTLFN